MQIKRNIAISETGFLFDPGSGDTYTLNPVGLEIFEYMRNGKSPEEITSLITNKYDVEASVFERYLYDFTAMLKHFQILETHD